MTQYDLDEATRQLGKLIHRAGKGESIAIVAKDGVVARLFVESAEGDHPRSEHDHEGDVADRGDGGALNQGSL